VDDSAYLRKLIDAMKEQYSVNDRRVYLIGHSNGAYMSHRMAMDHPDTIAAIAGLAGMPSFKLDGPEPVRPVNILQIHGTNDRVIQFEGGKIGNNAYPSARETIDLWAKYNGVPGRAQISPKKLDLDKSIEGDETTVTQYRDGRTELWAIQDGTHIPTISDTFSRQVIEWLMAHPKSKR
jgi:polyhydroxybutyrate depolymerase